MIALLLCLLSFFPYSTEKPSLTIEVEGMEYAKGQIMIAIYNQSEGFMDSDRMFRAEVVPVTNSGEMAFSVNLPQGEYAVTLYQDLNLDVRLNTNFVGFPIEPFGFSNNPKIRFGPPNFKETSFKHTRDQRIQIRLQ